MNIGNKLKKIRIKHGLTQNEMAARLKINKSTLCRYENGDREPSVEFVAKVLKKFDVSPMWFLYSNSSMIMPFQHSQNLEQLFKKVKELIKDVNIKEIEKTMATDGSLDVSASIENFVFLNYHMLADPKIRESLLNLVYYVILAKGGRTDEMISA